MVNLVTPREKWMSHFVKSILLFLVSRPACAILSHRARDFPSSFPDPIGALSKFYPFKLRLWSSFPPPPSHPSFVVLLFFYAKRIPTYAFLFSLILHLRRLLPNFFVKYTETKFYRGKTVFQSNQILSVFQIPDSHRYVFLVHVKCARLILISRVSLQTCSPCYTYKIKCSYKTKVYIISLSVNSEFFKKSE